MNCCACKADISVIKAPEWARTRIRVYYELPALFGVSDPPLRCCSSCMDVLYGKDTHGRLTANRIWTTHFYLDCK